MPTSTSQENNATQVATSAVLYICAARSPHDPGLAEKRARIEGHQFADRHAFRIVGEVVDLYGEPVPQKRSGWMHVREMAERGEIEVAIIRWPNAISPDHELRFPEIDELGRHGCQVRFSWAPLTAMAGGGATR